MLVALAVLVAAIAAPSGVALAGSPRPLGGNVNGQTNYVADFALADAYVTAGTPRSLDADGSLRLDSPAPLDGQGWPRTDFGVYINEIAPQPGVYTVSGSAPRRPNVALRLTPGSVGQLRWNARRRTFTVPVTVASQGKPGGQGQFILTFTGTGGGVRDLHVLRPGHASPRSPVFSRHYVAFLKAHRPTVLRMMDLTQTNNNMVSRWSERTLPGRWGMRTLTRTVPVDGSGSERITSERGLAWEDAIDLCNEVGSDCWINVPLLADDDYVVRLARLVRARLHRGLKVWVEYSNELWNDGFWQAHVNRALAKADAPAGRGKISFDGESDIVALGDRRVASRISVIGKLFRSVFTTDANRVRPVLAFQYANPDRTRNQLAYIAATRGVARRMISALAIAPYVNLGFAGDVSLDMPGLGTDDVLRLLGDDIGRFEHSGEMPVWVDMARSHGLALTAYEGGPDTFGPENVDSKTAATLDPRMQGLVERYLRAWFSQGGGQFNWFTLGADPYGHRFGSWSISNDIERLDSPKSLGFLAVRDGG